MPLAIVTVTATWVARSLRRDSIYADALRRRGVDFDLAFEQMALLMNNAFRLANAPAFPALSLTPVAIYRAAR